MYRLYEVNNMAYILNILNEINMNLSDFLVIADLFLIAKVLDAEVHFPCSFLRHVGQIAYKSDQVNLLEAHVLVLVLTNDVLGARWRNNFNVVVHAGVLWVREDVIVVDTLKLRAACFLAHILVCCKSGECFFAELWDVEHFLAPDFFSEPILSSLWPERPEEGFETLVKNVVIKGCFLTTAAARSHYPVDVVKYEESQWDHERCCWA